MLSHEELQQCVETMQEIFYKKMCVFSFSLFPYRNSAHRYHPGNPQQCCIFHFPVDTPSPRQGIHSLRNLKDLLGRKVVIPFAVICCSYPSGLLSLHLNSCGMKLNISSGGSS